MPIINCQSAIESRKKQLDQIAFDFEQRLSHWQTQGSKIPTIPEADPVACPSTQASGTMSRSLARELGLRLQTFGSEVVGQDSSVCLFPGV